MLLKTQLKANSRLVVVPALPPEHVLFGRALHEKVIVPLARLHGLDRTRFLNAEACENRPQRAVGDVSVLPRTRRGHCSPQLPADVRHLRLPLEPRRLRRSKLRVAVGPPRPDELDERHDLLVRLSRA